MIKFRKLELGLCRAVARPVLAQPGPVFQGPVRARRPILAWFCACKLARPGPGRKLAALSARRPKRAIKNVLKYNYFEIILLKTVDTFTLHQQGTLNNTVLINICDICQFFGHVLTCIHQKKFGPFWPGP